MNNETKISKNAFISSAVILLILMISAGLLTKFLPSGSYSRIVVDSREIIDPNSFTYTAKSAFPVWRWFTAPIEVLWSSDAVMIIAIILFILIIGGSFAVLDKSGVLKAVIKIIVSTFGSRKYFLVCIIVFFFMILGAVLGTFEETVTLVPITVTLAHSLGWDSLMGLGMSLLAACFGFAAAISNPFSIGVAQKIAGLPMFSGSSFRIGIFLAVYTSLCIFLVRHGKKVEAHPQKSPVYEEDRAFREKYSSNPQNAVDDSIPTKSLKLSTKWFQFFITAILIVMLSTSFVPGLSDLSLPIVGLLFFIGGMGSGLLAGLKLKEALKAFAKGISGIAPGIILILMAMSVKHIITNGGIMDTILHGAAMSISSTTPFAATLLIYVLVLGMNFFVGSASAKAFLIMPIITPLAGLIGVSRQVTVLAFCLGDGFSNVIYPTNPVLLICLGLTVVSYPKWFKWTIGLQVLLLLVSCIFLGLAVAIGYGPF